jgi:hypothetical protein
LDVSLAMCRQWTKRAIQFSRGPEQFIAQPLGIVARQAEGGGKDTGFVLAFPVDWVERVIAQFGHVHERSVCIWQIHFELSAVEKHFRHLTAR